MAEIRHSIDWFQYSVDWPSHIKDWPLIGKGAMPVLRTAIPYMDTQGWEPERGEGFRLLPMAGYPKAYDLLYASAHVDPNRREQKIGVRMTGHNLAAFRSLGGTEGRLLTFYKEVKAKASRIDIAFDLMDYGVDPLRVYADWEKGKVKSNARTVQPFTKATRNSDGTISKASTLYFGSRESELMVRMYEKGKQMQTDLDWVRIELEVKGDKACAVCQDIERLGVAAVGRELLRGYFSKMPYKFWPDLIAGDSVPLTHVGRKMTAHDAWLLNIIIPMLQEDIRKEWEGETERGITRNVEALIRENWTRRMMCLREQYGFYKSSDSAAAD